MVHCVGRIFRTILGGRSSQIVRRTLRRNPGNISIVVDGSCLLDTGHSVSLVLSLSTVVECTVPTFQLPIGRLCGRSILYVRSNAQLLCHQFIPSIVHIWHPNRFVILLPIKSLQSRNNIFQESEAVYRRRQAS